MIDFGKSRNTSLVRWSFLFLSKPFLCANEKRSLGIFIRLMMYFSEAIRHSFQSRWVLWISAFNQKTSIWKIRLSRHVEPICYCFYRDFVFCCFFRDLQSYPTLLLSPTVLFRMPTVRDFKITWPHLSTVSC